MLNRRAAPLRALKSPLFVLLLYCVTTLCLREAASGQEVAGLPPGQYLSMITAQGRIRGKIEAVQSLDQRQRHAFEFDLGGIDALRLTNYLSTLTVQGRTRGEIQIIQTLDTFREEPSFEHAVDGLTMEGRWNEHSVARLFYEERPGAERRQPIARRRRPTCREILPGGPRVRGLRGGGTEDLDFEPRWLCLDSQEARTSSAAGNAIDLQITQDHSCG